jgi:acetyl-CoA C-acetyltransferase
MSRKVAIVAVAQTKYEASNTNQSNSELLWEVTKKILEQTNLKFENQVDSGLCIDKIIHCSEDFWQGRTISDLTLHPEMGGYAMDVSKVAADGTQAVYHAAMSILSGHHDVILVTAQRKESETIGSSIENNAFDPIFLRPLGFDFLTAAALQATRYMHMYGLTEEHFARVAVKNRKNAKNNPYARREKAIAINDVMRSKMLAYPIKQLDAKPVADGACAIVVASEEAVKKLTDNPVWITGLGNCYDAHYPGDRELSRSEALSLASKKAYSMAGINNPRKEINLAEIADEYSYQELLWAEGLGLCDEGKGGELIESGSTEIGGKLPVNTAGGLLAGLPSGVAGMAQTAEAFLQLQGKAGARQVDGAKTALVQGTTGPCGQSHCVIILDRRKGEIL